MTQGKIGAPQMETTYASQINPNSFNRGSDYCEFLQNVPEMGHDMNQTASWKRPLPNGTDS